MEILERITENVIMGSAKNVEDYAKQAITEGIEASEILDAGLIAGMNVVGIRFRANEMYVPEVLMSARAMHKGLAIVRPLIVSAGIKEKGIVAIGTVRGDLHDIGKNLVIMMLEGAGYKVIDLGVDVPTEKFIETVEIQKPHIVGISALLTTTMTQMQETVEKLKVYNNELKIMVGGAPVTQKFADEIGADGYASDAASAVKLVEEMMTI